LVPFVILILFLLLSNVIRHVITFGSFLNFFPELIEHHLRFGERTLLKFWLAWIIFVVNGIELKSPGFFEGRHTNRMRKGARGSSPNGGQKRLLHLEEKIRKRLFN
jgi:hypothetical protein